MLSVEDCRKLLSRKDNKRLSDDDVATLRDQAVALADLAFEIYQQKRKEGKLGERGKQLKQNLPSVLPLDIMV